LHIDRGREQASPQIGLEVHRCRGVRNSKRGREPPLFDEGVDVQIPARHLVELTRPQRLHLPTECLGKSQSGVVDRRAAGAF
jgi:hypothetical protein